MNETLSTLGQLEYQRLSEQIAENLYSTSYWQKANVIGITISRFPEVNTYPIIEKAWREGKTVTVPKCIPKTRKLDFRKITDFSQCEKGYFQLIEPLINQTEAVEKNSIDLLIVPGLAFTENGERIGFGGGYYDRYLEQFNGPTLSLAFEIQIVQQLPLEEHDFQIDQIISEANIYDANKKNYRG